jgi:hypothetical protein
MVLIATRNHRPSVCSAASGIIARNDTTSAAYAAAMARSTACAVPPSTARLTTSASGANPVTSTPTQGVNNILSANLFSIFHEQACSVHGADGHE